MKLKYKNVSLLLFSLTLIFGVQANLVKRQSFLYYSWENKDMSISPTFNYTILNHPPTLSMSDVSETMSKAFNAFSSLSPTFLTSEIPFSEYNCDIHCNSGIFNISFESGKHGTFFFDLPFDGTVAGHAIHQLYIHFNKDIKWKKYSVGEKVDNSSTDFYSVALFTVGQLLGWDPCENETSIMYEGYRDPVDENGNYVEPVFSEYDIEQFEADIFF